jgi:hypothetical protein
MIQRFFIASSQPVDTHIGKAFKDHLKEFHLKWVNENIDVNSSSEGNIKDPPQDLVIEWICKAFDSIKGESIIILLSIAA